MKSVAKAIEENGTPWNIYLAETGTVDEVSGYAESYNLIMPSETFTFPDTILRKKTGLVIKWPVNPHNTGETGILDILNNQTDFNVSCQGYAKDQNGRWFKCQ